MSSEFRSQPQALPTLHGLEISLGEVRHLCGCDPSELWRASLLRDRRSWLMFWLQEVVLALMLTPIAIGGIYIFILRSVFGESGVIRWSVLLCLVLVPLAIVVGRWIWRSQSTPQTLVALLDDLDRYHNALKAVAIAEELAQARNQAIDPEEGAAVRSALELTRSDLVRAFTTERILRDNRDVLAVDFKSFGDSFTALQALRADVTARDYQEVLQRTIAIGASVREEMRKLQD